MMGQFSIWHWLIVLLVVILIFGTKKLRNIGSDVGGAVRNFKDAMNEEKSSSVASADSTHLIEAVAVEIPATKSAPKKKASTVKKAAASKPAASKAKTTTTKKASTTRKAKAE